MTTWRTMARASDVAAKAGRLPVLDERDKSNGAATGGAAAVLVADEATRSAHAPPTAAAAVAAVLLDMVAAMAVEARAPGSALQPVTGRAGMGMKDRAR